MAGASTERERETLLLPDEDVIINCQMSSSPYDGYGHGCVAAAIVSSESGTHSPTRARPGRVNRIPHRSKPSRATICHSKHTLCNKGKLSEQTANDTARIIFVHPYIIHIKALPPRQSRQ